VDIAPEWIAAGAAAVSMGTALTDGDRDVVAKRVAELLGCLDDAAGAEDRPQG
jgi:2-dehydro-3-deoxyphosphogluconate aldolase/(4S)-4-hydroxy-2-oxoglutarate aldolase